MAIIVQVKPEFDGKIAIQSSGSLNGTILSNSLPQETLYAIYQAEDELRPYLTTTFSTVGGSYPAGTIDPSLLHAYDSSEVTHNPAGVFGAGTLGKALVETKAKIDGLDGAFVSPTTAPSFQLNFAGGKFWNPKIPFSRNSVGTYIDQNGVMKTALANKPRFTHDPVTKESLGLLMEEGRTNLATYSNDFSNVSYTKARLTLQNVASVLDPDLTTATKLVEDTSATNTHQLTKGDCAVVAGQTYTGSVFLKAAERSVCIVQLSSSSVYGGVNPSVIVDLGLGTLSSSNNNLSSKIENYGNGWYRVSVTATVVSNGVSGANIQLCQGQTPTYTGDGTSGVYIFGMQFEQGLNATSYIPTTTAAITRNSDFIDITGSVFSEIFGNISEGTIFFHAKKASLRGTGNFKFYLRFRNTSNNMISITDSDNARVYNEIIKDSTPLFNTNGTNINQDEYFQNVFGFALNNARAYNNANASTLDTDCVMPVGINQLTIGGDITTVIKSISFWPRRMTDSGMFALSNPMAMVGLNPSQLLPAGRGNRTLHITPESILRTLGKQEFSLDGTGASVTRNIRRPYDFTFEVVDNSGVTTMTATPGASCTANTDNALTFTAPSGKTLTYAITPVYDV